MQVSISVCCEDSHHVYLSAPSSKSIDWEWWCYLKLLKKYLDVIFLPLQEVQDSMDRITSDFVFKYIKGFLFNKKSRIGRHIQQKFS